jgi:hypothetical protein
MSVIKTFTHRHGKTPLCQCYGQFPVQMTVLQNFGAKCYFCKLGAICINSLTGLTRIFVSLINGMIWSMFLKYLAKMHLILILSKFAGQIDPKPKRFVFHSTI